MGVIFFNGKNSKDYGIEVETFPEYVVPKRMYDVTHVPGRNGDLVLDTGSYSNVTQSYSISFGREQMTYEDMAGKVARWLHNSIGYCKLEDSYNPHFYRLALYEEEVAFSNISNEGGKATISFNCKPQKFLKNGDRKQTFTKTGSIKNPTFEHSRPIVTVYGEKASTKNAAITIGTSTVTFGDGIDGYVTIDSEIQDVYKNEVNMNQSVTLSSGYPLLTPGVNSISFSNSGIKKVEVISKWWTV